jgi:hypothetical protein
MSLKMPRLRHFKVDKKRYGTKMITKELAPVTKHTTLRAFLIFKLSIIPIIEDTITVINSDICIKAPKSMPLELWVS